MSDYERWLEESTVGKSAKRLESPEQYRFFDYFGDEISYQKWMWLIDSGGAKYVTVAMDAINEFYVVATMWNGILNIDDPEPVLYCTYILHNREGEGEMHSDHEIGSSSLDEAVRVHNETVESAKEYADLREQHPIDVVQEDLNEMVRGLMDSWAKMQDQATSQDVEEG